MCLFHHKVSILPPERKTATPARPSSAPLYQKIYQSISKDILPPHNSSGRYSAEGLIMKLEQFVDFFIIYCHISSIFATLNRKIR